jgi:hypothetical protein
MEENGRVADDFKVGIGPTTIEVLGKDTPQNRRWIYRQTSEVPEDQRLKGLFKFNGQIACVPSIVQADIRQRASNPPDVDQVEATSDAAAQPKAATRQAPGIKRRLTPPAARAAHPPRVAAPREE